MKPPRGRRPILWIALALMFLILVAMVDVFGYHLP